jgi:hypothetical protein
MHTKIQDLQYVDHYLIKSGYILCLVAAIVHHIVNNMIFHSYCQIYPL